MSRWRKLYDGYVRTAPALGVDEVEAHLWNDATRAGTYGADDERYRTALLEQYKIYVEMADRISARRALANTFFLTLNSAAFTLIGVFGAGGLPVPLRSSSCRSSSCSWSASRGSGRSAPTDS